MNKSKRYKLKRKPYKGETWDILEKSGEGWIVHSSYPYSSLRDEAFKKLVKEEM